MKAVKRWGIAIAVAGLTLGAPAHAQDSPAPAATNQTDTVGPPELQNFSLSGTVTRQSDQTAIPSRRSAAPARPASPETNTATRAPSTPTPNPGPTRSAANDSSPTRAAPTRDAAPEVATRTEPRPAQARAAPAVAERANAEVPQVSSMTVKLPPAGTAEPGPVTVADPAVPGGRSMPIWPWLLAALALGAGAAFLLRRNRQQEAFAGGPQVDAFVAPQPAPAPVPPRQAAPTTPGLVSTRLRPWLDVIFQPLRCIVENDRVHFEFEVELVNSGTASARDVLIEASMINASPTQDQDLAKFFGNPVGEGERIPAIPPLKRVSLRPKLTVPLDQVRVLDAGGRKVFVPLLAFNALYDWGRGEGQTSAAYLVGRDTKGERMSPFRLDLGPRVFRGVGARELPVAVRA